MPYTPHASYPAVSICLHIIFALIISKRTDLVTVWDTDMSATQDRDRFNRLAAVFDQTVKDANATSELAASIQSLDKLRGSELRVWWDANTLKMYIDRDMIPRGLRLKKAPTMIYTPDFLTEWNQILSKCSSDLIKLIISHEDVKLVEIRNEIQVLQQTMDTKFAALEEYKNAIAKMETNLNKLETTIADTKKRKYQRDIQDYAKNEVYTWKTDTKGTRSILRNQTRFNRKKRQPNVSFSDMESTDSNTDISDQDASSNNMTNAGHRNKSPSNVAGSSSAPFLGMVTQGGGAAGVKADTRRYPKRGPKNTN